MVNLLKGIALTIKDWFLGFLLGRGYERGKQLKKERDDAKKDQAIAAEPDKRGSALLDSLSDD